MKIIRILILNLATFSLIASVSAGQGPIPMPGGFADIYLGMPLQDFLATRPNCRPFSLFEAPASVDTNKPSQMLIEQVSNHPLFDKALYDFQNTRLNSVVLLGELRMPASDRKTERFIDQLVTAWGEPTEMEVVSLDEGKGQSKAPALFWKKEGVLIAAAFTPDEFRQKNGRGSLQLKLQRSSEQAALNAGKLFEIVAVTDDDKKSALSSARGLIQKSLMNQKLPEPVQ